MIWQQKQRDEEDKQRHQGQDCVLQLKAATPQMRFF